MRRWVSYDLTRSRTCRAAFDPEMAAAHNNGKYMVDCQVADDKCKPYAKDPVSGWVLGRWA